MTKEVAPQATIKTKQINPEPIIGPGKFQWNLGGWFGASLGSSAWMFALAVLLVREGEALLAGGMFGWFCVVNFAAYILWTHRHRIAPFWGLQALLLLIAIAIPSAFYPVTHWATPTTIQLLDVPTYTFWIYLIGPAIMVLFAFQERKALRSK